MADTGALMPELGETIAERPAHSGDAADAAKAQLYKEQTALSVVGLRLLHDG